MNKKQRITVGCIVLSLLVLAGLIEAPRISAQRKPQLSLSTTRIRRGLKFEVHGTGFTPKSYAISHLRKPDGTEYGVRRFLINDAGEYYQLLDTTMLELGAHVIWAEDQASKSVSNSTEFDVHEDPVAP